MFNGICLYSDNNVGPTEPKGEIVSTEVLLSNGQTTELFAPNRSILVGVKLSVKNDLKLLTVTDLNGTVLFSEASSLNEGANFLTTKQVGSGLVNMSVVCSPR